MVEVVEKNELNRCGRKGQNKCPAQCGASGLPVESYSQSWLERKESSVSLDYLSFFSRILTKTLQSHHRKTHSADDHKLLAGA